MKTVPTNRKRHDSRRGAAIIEASILLPLFLIFWFGIVDWGIAFWIHETVVHNANAAVRWQVVNTICTTWDATGNTCTAIDDTRIKKMFLYGDPNSTSTSTPWFSFTAPTIDVSLPGSKVNDDLRVTMTVSNYQWMHFTPFFGSRYFGRPITVSLPVEDLVDGL